jgi:hypothetical protein
MLLPKVSHRDKTLLIGCNKGNIHSYINDGKLVEFFKQNTYLLDLLHSKYKFVLIEYAEAREFTREDFQNSVKGILDDLPIFNFYHYNVLGNATDVLNKAQHLCHPNYILNGSNFFMKWRFQRSGDSLHLFEPTFPKNIDYKFLFLNRAFRLGRNLFFQRVKDQIGLDSFLFSKPTYLSPERQKKIEVNFNNKKINFIKALLNPNYLDLSEEIFLSFSEDVIPNIPQIVDRTSEETWPQEEFYEGTFCELVTETFSESGIHTNFTDNSGIFISEKVFKPLLACRPFILNANPFTLAELKKLGFKTFDKYWDEEYDSILDINQRHDKLLDIISYINKKPNNELSSILLDMKDILLFNRAHALKFMFDDINFFE